MAYNIDFSEDAERHLSRLRARDRRILIDAIEIQLTHQPTVGTRHRKRLRESPLASWQLSVGDFRVLYNVDEELVLVLIIAIGVKVHNRLLIEGKEYHL